jgi:hypothetical protein
MAKGMKSSFGICFMQDRALFWITIVTACDVIVEAHYSKLVQVESTMTTSTMVSLIMTISTPLHLWRGKRWETSLCTWTPFSNAIVAMVFRSVSWATMCWLLHEQCSKWIPKSSIIWPHWHNKRCGIIGCGIPKQIWSVVSKWVEDKRNGRVLGRVNNQAPATKFAQEWKHAGMTS